MYACIFEMKRKTDVWNVGNDPTAYQHGACKHSVHYAHVIINASIIQRLIEWLIYV